MENKFIEIKNKISLLDYAQKVLKLKNVHNKYIGICPFHLEKTPSFYIDPYKDLYYCFGCASGGDLFDFYAKFHNCSKKDALVFLAEIAGVELFQKKKNDLNLLLDFFKNQNKHIEFLKFRGLNDQEIAKFELGWAPDFDLIKSFIKENKLNLFLFGLKDSFFKMFQNRVVFPIFDEYGSLISFGGRTLSNDSNIAKYINGPETSIFEKSKILYGLNFLKNKSEIYLVEGYLDKILLDNAGYSSVASMGTAVSLNHLNLLWKHTKKIIVAMDGDRAGQAAMLKIAFLSFDLIDIDKEIFFVRFEKNDDPASYIEKNKQINLPVMNLCEFLFYYEKIPKDFHKKALIYKNFMDHVQKIKNPILRSEYKKNFNDLWWKKNNKSHEKLKDLSQDYLILLLFKYIIDFPEILEKVSEDFLKLPMSQELNENFIKFLNFKNMDKNFLMKINEIKLTNEILAIEKVLKIWYRIADRVNFLIYDIEYKKQKFFNNFSEEAWEEYKKWIKEKEEEND